MKRTLFSASLGPSREARDLCTPLARQSDSGDHWRGLSRRAPAGRT